MFLGVVVRFRAFFGAFDILHYACAHLLLCVLVCLDFGAQTTLILVDLIIMDRDISSGSFLTTPHAPFKSMAHGQHHYFKTPGGIKADIQSLISDIAEFLI